MIFDLVENWKNWNKYKHSLVLGKYIIQTSVKKELMSDEIKIKNYIMTKKIDSPFLDFRPTYFDKFRAKKNILLEQFNELFGDYLIENDYYSINNDYDLVINDWNKDIYIKEIIRDLVIVEFDNKEVMIYFGNKETFSKEELGDYILYEHPKFLVFNMKIITIYSLAELQAYFNITFRQVNTLRILDKIIKLFNRQQKIKRISTEEETFTSLFSKNNVKLLQQYDFEKYLYFNDEFKIKHKDLINVASVGNTGSGKTFTLNLLLLQILFGGNFKRVIYFDTQDSFKYNIMNNVNPIYLNRVKYLQENYFKITEETFYLSELDFVMSINFLLETKGYSSGEAKGSVVEVEYDEYSEFKQAVEEILHKKKTKLSVMKDLNKLEDLESIERFMKKVKVKKGSIFDDLESKKQFFVIFSFQDSLFYEVSTYLYLQKLKDVLFSRTEKNTYLFTDETQKYLSSSFLKKILLDLVKEKRQFGFRFYFTGLSYIDVKDFMKFAQHIVFNSFNDQYMLNVLKSMTSTPIESLKSPFEKIINDTNANKVHKTFLRTNFITEEKNLGKALLNGEEVGELTQKEKEQVEKQIEDNNNKKIEREKDFEMMKQSKKKGLNTDEIETNDDFY